MASRLWVGSIFLLLGYVDAARAGGSDPTEPDDLPAPQLEVSRERLAPPAIASFLLPPTPPGFHRPRELRVRGRALFGTQLTVHGYVTAIYDCAAELAARYPKLDRAGLLLEIDRDPRQCERPHFYLGETRDSPPALSIFVVDVPRKPAKPEREALSRAELAAWPRVPALAVGDAVQVSGLWTTEAPRGQRSTRGLLVYRASQPEPALPTATEQRLEVLQPVALGAPASVKPSRRKAVDNWTFNASVDALNICTREVRAAKYEDAMAACNVAITKWGGNHLAWYTIASIHIARREWLLAHRALARALTLRSDVAMYQQYAGMALYERVRDDKGDLAEEPAASLELARAALQRAVELEPSLWRAHLYLGRVYAALDDARGAAEQFALAIATNRVSPNAYVALAELYRSWDYVPEASAIVQLGLRYVPPAQAADLWYEAGMVFDAQRADAKGIDAFTKVLALQADVRARFQRGQLYLRAKDVVQGRKDLEEVLQSPDATPLMRTLASQWTARLMRRQGPAAGDCPRRSQCIKDTDGVGGP